jgi:hypothetical protein
VRTLLSNFAQVDSVLSADGRRPVRRQQYNADVSPTPEAESRKPKAESPNPEPGSRKPEAGSPSGMHPLRRGVRYIQSVLRPFVSSSLF